MVDRSYGLINDFGTIFSFQLIVSMQVFFFTLIAIFLLKRTQQFGYIIVMISHMIFEIGKYFSTFGALFFIFLVVLRLCHIFLKVQIQSLYDTFLDIFDAFIGNTRIYEYNYPEGQFFIIIFALLSQVFLLSFLLAMFVLRYFHLWKNIEATRRMEIIKLKNT